MRAIIDFIFFYFPYRVFKYYSDDLLPRFSAVVALLAIYMFQLVGTFFIINSFTGIFEGRSRDRLVVKYVYGPILISGVLIVMIMFYLINRNKFKLLFIKFDNYPNELNKRLGWYCLAYFFFAIIILGIGITSPLWKLS